MTTFLSDLALGPPFNSLCYISPPSITTYSSFLPFYYVLYKILQRLGYGLKFITSSSSELC